MMDDTEWRGAVEDLQRVGGWFSRQLPALRASINQLAWGLLTMPSEYLPPDAIRAQRALRGMKLAAARRRARASTQRRRHARH